MKWRFLPTVYWLLWFLAFAVWEFRAAEHGMGNKDVPMLTQAVVKWVPWYVTLPFISWLFIHFAIRYFNPTYIEWLRTR